jgi:hypothetical protein
MRVALVAGAEAPVRATASDPLAWGVWQLSLELSSLGCQVELIAPGGSRPPAGGDLHLIPGSHDGPSSDCDAQAYRWHRDVLASCDVVHDLSSSHRVVEELFLSDPEGARYVYTAWDGKSHPRFGRRCAIAPGADAWCLTPWARLALGGSGHLEVYQAVMEGKSWAPPQRLPAHPNRLLFQRWCCRQVPGRVLNAGCNADPAALASLFSGRVVGMDYKDYEEGLFLRTGQKVPIPADVVHDMTVRPWPFPDDTFDLVVFGDVLEDLADDGCQLEVLAEAARVATHVCITTPEDTPERDSHHRTTITRERLLGWLEATGWRPLRVEDVDYYFVPRGTFAFAQRINPARD